jgi:hypothetical protein
VQVSIMLTPVVTEITEGTAHLSEDHEPCILHPALEVSDTSDRDEVVGPAEPEV